MKKQTWGVFLFFFSPSPWSEVTLVWLDLASGKVTLTKSILGQGPLLQAMLGSVHLFRFVSKPFFSFLKDSHTGRLSARRVDFSSFSVGETRPASLHETV